MSYLKHSSALLLIALLPAAVVAQSTGPKPTPKPAAEHAQKPAEHVQKPAALKITEAAPGLLAKATVPAEAAEQAALAKVPEGKVVKGSIADMKGALTYSFEVRSKAGMEKVDVDAKTGVATVIPAVHAPKKAAPAPKSGGTRPSH